MAEANFDLLINGTSLRGISGVYVQSWQALLMAAPYRGANRMIPGLPGEVGIVKVTDSYVMDFPIVVTASAKYAQVAILAAIDAAVGADNLVTLTRRLPTDAAGTYADTTCNADYQRGVLLDSINWLTGRTTLSFVNLDGGWS